MLADFIYQPVSGQYDEKIFDLTNTWKSSGWCWVKFTNDNGDEWVGVFRGTPIKVAVADAIMQVAVLTDDALYIIDSNERDLLFVEEQTDYRDLASSPSSNQFILASYYYIGTFDRYFNFEVIETDLNIQLIKFKDYIKNNLKLELMLLNNQYEHLFADAIFDTENHKIEIL